MKICERIRKIRKELKLNQESFAESLGMSRANLCNIEVGRIVVTERNIRSICSVYGVSEAWLRDGFGEPFAQQGLDATLDAITERYHESKAFRAILGAYFRLTPAQQEAFERFVDNLAELLADEPATDDLLGGMTSDQLVAALDAQTPPGLLEIIAPDRADREPNEGAR